ncbi:ATP synthase subunit delta [Elstera cyanobacteriorum]|uniref:F0F1 ATP synthase subunit delta n=1 Tax=Elstera cyanobacteriorum TaxID=2022747 RepID=UPI0019A4A277|nr:F0F1 ATP synthase subunit delta [Elstera cyanobacteriorum]GFZ95510.1 ATP synthase subunit delta [Elstera cyanobacteriorum]
MRGQAGVATEQTGVAGRYAVALYDLAETQGALDAVANDLRALKALLDESADLRRLIASAVLSRDDQTKAIGAVLEKAGAVDLVRRFVGVVAENRRLASLPQMIAAFLARLAEKRGEVTAEVTAAVPLLDYQIDQIKTSLAGSYGSKVMVDVKVDPSLIGGLVVKIGSKLIDHSLKTKLTRLQLAMKGVG